MSAVIFCGPTLQKGERAAYASFDFRPPVRQGELYAAARKSPRAIGVIDGYFDGQPAVWHKEILWALANGVAVFGASSMGALRAAELHTFGMRGVGSIFEAYRDGRLTDDDEVALVHGPAETGYLRLSEPMVNIRATLERAISEHVLDDIAAETIAALGKAQFYQERSWASVLADAAERLPPDPYERFATWLANGKVDRKRDDALLLLDAVQAFLADGGKAEAASFSFEWTETWANAPWRTAPPEIGPAEDEEAILDELRLDGGYWQIRKEALSRLLASNEADATGAVPDRTEIAREIMAFRSPRGLVRQNDVHRWAAENDTSAEHFEQMMTRRASVEKLARSRDAELRPLILDQLREDDAYVALRERARAKARLCRAPGNKIPPPLLVSWYFGKRLGISAPDDLGNYAASIGLADLGRFYELLAAEYAFCSARSEESSLVAPDENL
jgi:hypothetical protein